MTESVYISPDSLPKSYRPDIYTLGYGDMIDVNLLHNEKYSRTEIRVRPDGMISYPYVGEIDVSGMTVEELDKYLTESFASIIKHPEVSVIIREFRPMTIYVLGQVELPNAYEADQANNLLGALSLARGLTNEARKNGVLVIRKTGPDHVVGIQVDLRKILKENRYEYNIPLEPNDIVMVPRSRISKLDQFISSYLGILEEPFDLLRTFYYMRQAQATYEHFVLR